MYQALDQFCCISVFLGALLFGVILLVKKYSGSSSTSYSGSNTSKPPIQDDTPNRDGPKIDPYLVDQHEKLEERAREKAKEEDTARKESRNLGDL